MVDDGRTTDGRTTDGRTTEHGYTISSPCEPDGSGELIMVRTVYVRTIFHSVRIKDSELSVTCTQ